MTFSTHVMEKTLFRHTSCPPSSWLRAPFYRASPLVRKPFDWFPRNGSSSVTLPRPGRRRTCLKNWVVGHMEEGVTRLQSKQMGMVSPADEIHVEEAVEALKSGQVIAVPTDTLYGFACDACSMAAVNKIYEIKGRKHTRPLAICVGNSLDISKFAVTDNLPDGLLASLLPGPVTVVLLRGSSSMLHESLNPGIQSIGIRVPDASFIQQITQGFGSAVALTSANLSGHPSSVNIKDFEDLWQFCSYVYDGGLLPVGRAGSTVVDLTEPGKYKILRPGSALEETETILQRFDLEKLPE